MSLIPEHRRSVESMKHAYNNRIFRMYGIIERSNGPKLDIVIREKIARIPGISTSTALDYACGSGLLSLKLLPLFKSVTGRDLSIAMLERAKGRAKKMGCVMNFLEGNILAIDEQEKSYDYVFVSFALHLFPPVQEEEILKKLYKVARKSVIIIDHGKKWNLGVAIIEWLEGGYYDKFIKLDFNSIARKLGCEQFEEAQIADCTVLFFHTGEMRY